MYTVDKINIFADIDSLIVQKSLNQMMNLIKDRDEVVKGTLLPDCHEGYTLPIGGVVAVKGMIFPSFVGYDIGCGMCAVKTSFSADDVRENAVEIWKRIQELIPVGFNHHKEDQVWEEYDKIEKTDVTKEIFEKNGLRQIATLGGGNHFIEVGFDAYDKIWVIIHSGSRGIGHAIGTYYMRLAADGKAKEGYYGFDVNSDEGQNYITDMNFALEFALENRRQMLVYIEKAMQEFCDGGFDWDNMINRNHNHAELREMEEYGKVWIHRKGATHAEDGMFGVIPGDMRNGSFIVRGLGNPQSLFSSSHGAGRVLGRKEAKRTLSLDEFSLTMEGIVANVDEQRLDESPFAYKNIFEVMDNQKDLVEVVAHVLPILNVKG